MLSFLDFVIIVFLLAIVVGLFVFILKKNNTNTFLGNPQKFVPTEDVTTVLPIPIHAATCDHEWDAVTDKVLEMPHEKKCVVVLSCRKCGSIDKTVQTTSPLPEIPPQPPKPCNHNWNVVVQQNLEVEHEKKIVVVLTCANCGSVDKTVETTSKAPNPQWKKSECRHEWETEKRVVLDSAYEQMLKSISATGQGYSSKPKVNPEKKLDLNLNDSPPWMFQKTYISIRICKTCGEIDKTIASNFEGESIEGSEEESE